MDRREKCQGFRRGGRWRSTAPAPPSQVHRLHLQRTIIKEKLPGSGMPTSVTGICRVPEVNVCNTAKFRCVGQLDTNVAGTAASKSLELAKEAILQ